MELEKIVRNALTGTLLALTAGLFISCSDSPVGPAEAALDQPAFLSIEPVEENLTCRTIDRLLVCDSNEPDPVTTLDGDDCYWLDGKLFCLGET